MRIVFFGTPAFAVPSLRALLATGPVAAVVTQPDRPRGRSRSTLDPSPVKRVALEVGAPLLQPDRPVGPEFETALAALAPDVGIVVAYGHILKPHVLAIPRCGMINLHASLLPAWRGAAPIAWSILGGDRETGVTAMQMEAGLDSGPILAQVRTPIEPTETAGALTERLATLGAGMLGPLLARLERGPIAGQVQDHARATFAPKIGREVARIRWDEPAEAIARRIRAFDPVPGAWARFRDQELKLFGPTPRGFSGPPGAALVVESELAIAGAGGSVAIAEVQPAGKTRMPATAWLRGHGVSLGERFE